MSTKEYKEIKKLKGRQFLKTGTRLISGKWIYEITEQVGQGGTSLVYRARILEKEESAGSQAGAYVILKEFYPDQSDDVAYRQYPSNDLFSFHQGKEWTMELMQQEKQAFLLSRELLFADRTTNDPHCWTYIDSFYENNTFYQVCYDVAGDSLDVVLRKGLFPCETLQDCVHLILQMLPAVAPLHGHGYVHCDVKPSNLFVTASNPPVFRCIDFGSAVPVGSETMISSSRSYAPPEVEFSEEGPYLKQGFFQRSRVDVTFDTYSILAILYEMITGTSPESGRAV